MRAVFRQHLDLFLEELVELFLQLGDVRVARRQGVAGAAVVEQRAEQVLERDGAVRLLTRKAMRPLQAFAKVGRHWDRFELVRNGLRHQQPPVRGAHRLGT